MPLAAAIRSRVSATPGLDVLLHELLERYATSARLPRHLTWTADEVQVEVLGEIFSTAAVSRVGPERVRLDLSKALANLPGGEAALVQALSDALDRPLPDVGAADRAPRLELRSALLALLEDARQEPTRAWLRACVVELGAETSELLELAKMRTLSSALVEARIIARAMDAVLENRELVRVQRFSALALGDSKALRWSGERFLRLCTALYQHSAETRRRVLELGDPPSEAAARALALEAHGIYRDVAAASALCFGALEYRKGGQVFGDVARHAARGECARLTVAQLADAEIRVPRFQKVRLIENLTPFLDYVEALYDARVTDELVVCSGGQASWAVVRLLRMLTPFSLDLACACDLDRSGVLIWRSLMRRTGARLRPWHLDVDTLRRWAHQGQPLSGAERGRLTALIAREDASEPGHALLQELLSQDVWVEQEAFSDHTLLAEVAAR